MGLFREYDPDQVLLLPQELREWLPSEHLAYFVSDLVDQLDLTGIYAQYSQGRRGQPAYHPQMLLKLLVYGYCVGIASSRRIEKETYEDIAFRVLACGQHPDHDTIAQFRQMHLGTLKQFFNQILALCKKAGLVKMGHVAVDGTKVKANASKHKAMSYDRMQDKEKFLGAQMEALFAEAERIDKEEDKLYGKGKRGDELPEEFRFRETRLKKIREAMNALKEEAQAKAKAQGKPDSEAAPVDPKAQKNFTDPESRIMKDAATKAFVQGYNAQVAVEAGSQVIVACEVTQAANDKQQAVPMMKQVKENAGELPLEASLDAGYFSEENVTQLEAQGIELFCPPDRIKHEELVGACVVNKDTETKTVKERMREKLKTPMGRWTYGKRKETVEPVIGQIKQGRGFRQFLMRGLRKAQAEWSLICATHNLLKLYRNSVKALKEQSPLVQGIGLQRVPEMAMA